MKKILLSFVMLMVCIATAFADEVVFDFTNPEGLTPSIIPSAEPSNGVDLDSTPFTNGGVSVVFASPENSQTARIWTNTEAKGLSKELRAYKNGTITISATSAITSIVFKGGKLAGMSVAEGVLSGGSWTGSSQKVTFNLSKTLNVDTIAVVCGEGGGDVKPNPQPEPQPETKAIFSETFETAQGAFTVENKVVPDSFQTIWNHDAGYKCMKATGFEKSTKTKHVTESWLVSPVVDLANVADGVLSFENAANFFGGQQGFVVKVKAEGADWADLVLENMADGKSWTFVTTTGSLKAYANKKIQFAFVYTSDSKNAGTWEVKNVKVVSQSEEVKPEPQPEPEPTVYSSIAELKQNASGDAVNVTFEFKDLVVIAKANNDIYVSNGNEAILLYGSENTLNVGDKISGNIKGALVSFFGLTEIKNVDYTGVQVVSSNNEVKPVVVTLAELAQEGSFAKYESMLVTVCGVKVGAKAFNNRNIVLTDGTNEVTLRDNYKSALDFVFDTAASYDIVGVVSIYQKKTQINLLNVEGIKVSTGIEAVESANGAQVIYDLSGRRVAKAVKGLYIINGKKVYVK